MASGKLSPRQKMINMMYLVLLALVAMNVSAEILDAFEQIKEKLDTSATQNESTHDKQTERMFAKIEEEKGKGKLHIEESKDIEALQWQARKLFASRLHNLFKTSN